MKRASLADIAQMKAKGELFHDPKAPDLAPPEYQTLDCDFWAKAVVIEPRKAGQGSSRSKATALQPHNRQIERREKG